LYIIDNTARFPKPAILKKPIHLVLILTLIHHAFWLFGLVVGLEERRECLREVQNYFEFIKSGHNKGKEREREVCMESRKSGVKVGRRYVLKEGQGVDLSSSQPYNHGLNPV
jgi:hypothetical protein